MVALGLLSCANPVILVLRHAGYPTPDFFLCTWSQSLPVQDADPPNSYHPSRCSLFGAIHPNGIVSKFTYTWYHSTIPLNHACTRIVVVFLKTANFLRIEFFAAQAHSIMTKGHAKSPEKRINQTNRQKQYQSKRNNQ